MPPPSKPPRSAATALDRWLARAPRRTRGRVIGALGVGDFRLIRPYAAFRLYLR
jgi:hypothetical protein